MSHFAMSGGFDEKQPPPVPGFLASANMDNAGAKKEQARTRTQGKGKAAWGTESEPACPQKPSM